MVARAFRNIVDNNIQNPSNYAPVGLPQSGDTVVILKFVDAIAQGVLPSGVQFRLSTFGFASSYESILLKDAIVPVDTYVFESTIFDTYSGSIRSSLAFAGAVVNNGTLVFSGGVQTVVLPSGTTLTNNGTIDVDGSAPQFSADGANVTFLNDGLIRIANPQGIVPGGYTGTGQIAVLGTAVDGTGTISVSVNSGLEFGGAVASGQTLQFVGGVNAQASVTIDQPSGFAATISGFVSGDMLRLATTAFTSVNYVAGGGGLGTLQVFNGGGTPVASLRFSGDYTANNFSLSESGTSLVITTNVTNAATGSTALPTSSGIFRFFDTSDGTHFYTSSVAERDNVLISRPDMVEENNGFGSRIAASASTESVYRFFDTVHGTHFFTASASERDQLVATRNDLAYEASATFLEDATPQAGDVTVYRLFSKADGTHLYTGSAAELSALTTSGGTSYRADLVSEGVSFYAPAGHYT